MSKNKLVTPFARHEPDFRPRIRPILVVAEQDVLSIGDNEDRAGVDTRQGRKPEDNSQSSMLEDSPDCTATTPFHLLRSIPKGSPKVQDCGRSLGHQIEIRQRPTARLSLSSQLSFTPGPPCSVNTIRCRDQCGLHPLAPLLGSISAGPIHGQTFCPLGRG
jgi:hypothetical protein